MGNCRSRSRGSSRGSSSCSNSSSSSSSRSSSDCSSRSSSPVVNWQLHSPLTALPTVLQTHLCIFLSLTDVPHIVCTCRLLSVAASRECSRRCTMAILTPHLSIQVLRQRQQWWWWWQRLLLGSHATPPLAANVSSPLTHHINALSVVPPDIDSTEAEEFDCHSFSSLTAFSRLERLHFYIGAIEPNESVLKEVFRSLSSMLRYVSVHTEAGDGYCSIEAARVYALIRSLPLLTHLRSLSIDCSQIDFDKCDSVSVANAADLLSPLLHNHSLRFLHIGLDQLEPPGYSSQWVEWWPRQREVIGQLAHRLVYAQLSKQISVLTPSPLQIITALAGTMIQSNAASSSTSSSSSSSFSSVCSSSVRPIGIQQHRVDVRDIDLSDLLPFSSSLTTLHLHMYFDQETHLHSFIHLRRLCLRAGNTGDCPRTTWIETLTCPSTETTESTDVGAGADMHKSNSDRRSGDAVEVHSAIDSSGSDENDDAHRCSLLHPCSSPASLIRTCCRHLHSLALVSWRIDRGSLQRLATTHSQLHTLIFSDCCYTADALSALTHFPHLTTLVLSHSADKVRITCNCSTCPDDFSSQWSHILQCTSLRRLYLYTHSSLPPHIVGKHASDFPTLPRLRHFSCQQTRKPLRIWHPPFAAAAPDGHSECWPSSAEYEAAFDEIQS